MYRNLLVLSQIAIVIALSGCISSQKKTEKLDSAFAPEVSEQRKLNWSFMVGTWYGSQPLKDGGTYNWIVRRNVQGQYRVDAQIINGNGEEKNQTEVGEWGIGGDIYFSVFKGWINNKVFKPNDSSDPYNRDVYRIKSLTSDEFTYQSLSSGSTYTVKKVADDFQLPTNL